MSKDRSASLDLSRFVAAGIVFIGHMLFLPVDMHYSNQITALLSPFRTGDIAVLYFFALSGYVLKIGPKNNTYGKWLKRRIIRLYPIYLSAWVFGLIIVVAHKGDLLNERVLGLGLLGFQSLDPKVNLVINAPLWSLSVEIIFAFWLYFFLKLRESPLGLLLIIVAGLSLWNSSQSSPILRAIPYFASGILLSSPFFKNMTIHQFRIRVLVIFLCIFYIFFGAAAILQIPSNIFGEVYRLFIVCILLLLYSQLDISQRFHSITEALGRRSFAIYAFHYPVLLIANYYIRPATSITFALYVILSISMTFLISEFAYRYIDEISIRFR